jgi:hypothetical protein
LYTKAVTAPRKPSVIRTQNERLIGEIDQTGIDTPGCVGERFEIVAVLMVGNPLKASTIGADMVIERRISTQRCNRRPARIEEGPDP